MSKQLARDQAKLKRLRNSNTGTHKKFSQEDYNNHNAPAVNAVLDYLDSQDIWAKENDDRYGPDIVVWEGLRPKRYIEVEQRKLWKTGPFPEAWSPVHIPERKGKYLKLGLPFELWVLSMDLKFCTVIPDYVIERGELMEFSNSRIKSGELFYHVPLEECIPKELT